MVDPAVHHLQYSNTYTQRMATGAGLYLFIGLHSTFLAQGGHLCTKITKSNEDEVRPPLLKGVMCSSLTVGLSSNGFCDPPPYRRHCDDIGTVWSIEWLIKKRTWSCVNSASQIAVGWYGLRPPIVISAEHDGWSISEGGHPRFVVRVGLEPSSSVTPIFHCSPIGILLSVVDQSLWAWHQRQSSNKFKAFPPIPNTATWPVLLSSWTYSTSSHSLPLDSETQNLIIVRCITAEKLPEQPFLHPQSKRAITKRSSSAAIRRVNGSPPARRQVKSEDTPACFKQGWKQSVTFPRNHTCPRDWEVIPQLRYSLWSTVIWGI